MKRIITFLLSLIILVFISSPVVIVKLLSKSFLDENSLDRWLDGLDTSASYFIKTILPVLIITVVNELILVVIDLLGKFLFILVVWEGHRKFSHHQRSYLRKVFIYFLFNMLIVPGVATSAISNLYEFFRSNWNDGLQFIKMLFILTKGDFFLSLLIQSGAGALFSQLTSLPMFFKNHFSPKLAYLTQMDLYQNEEWTKHDGNIFQYGHYYAQTCVVIGIHGVFQ